MEETGSEVQNLKRDLKELRAEINSVQDSPYLQKSIKCLVYELLLDREEVIANELGRRINEKHGTMFEVKQQARRMGILLGIDPDNVRLLISEALQNILEHGTGRWVTIRLELKNYGDNPCLISTFKHEIASTEKYTIHEIDQNAMKGDVTSEFFDFES